MYKLYYSPGACSMAVHIALLECNQQVELEKLDLMSGQQRSPEFLKINSRGQVPTLIEDGKPLREGAAIMIHILEKFKSPLLPASGPQRTAAIEWLMFGNATLHPAYGKCFFLKRGPESAEKQKLLEACGTAINNLWADVEQHLSSNEYLCGKECTMADILLTVIANWSGNTGCTINIGPNCRKLFAKVIARPAYKKALEVEQVEYKMAA